jgi:hypothetical protein
MFTQAMFLLDLESRLAAHDAVHDKQNFEVRKITLMEP